MKPLEAPLLADENIGPEVIRGLASWGKRIESVHDAQLAGRTDTEILRYAHSHGQVVLTHDGDFGTLAVRAGETFFGIVYLRPGHIASSFVVEMLEAIERSRIDVTSPFLLLAERKDHHVRMRVRSIAQR